MDESRSREEIEELKKCWLLNPIFDIFHTSGFEAHYDELLKFQFEQQKQWEEAPKNKLAQVQTDEGMNNDIENLITESGERRVRVPLRP